MTSTVVQPAAPFRGSLFGRARRQQRLAEPPPSPEVTALETLRSLPGWSVLDVPRGNFADYVVVTPASVLAVTARYHDAAEGETHVQRAWADIRTARGTAKLLELGLDSADGVEVHPVLMLWGPGAPDLENGHLLVKGVQVVDPRRPLTWAGLFRRPALDDVSHRRLVRDTEQLLRFYRNDAKVAGR